MEILNEIVHPLVHEDFTKWADEQDTPYVLYESAILVDDGPTDVVDKIITVTAEEEIRIDRVIKRNGLTHHEVKSRMNNQIKEEDRIGRSDYIIKNDAEVDDLRVIVNFVHNEIS